MRYFTGDESGLVKSIIFPAPVNEKKVKKQKPAEENEEDKQKEAPKLQINVFGKVSKEEGIEKMAWAVIDDQKQLIVARKNGKIQFMSPEDGSIIKEMVDENICVGPKKEGSFIGLSFKDGMLFTASSNGQISWTDLKSDPKSTTVIASLGKDLTCARLHPSKSHILAVGGKERELTVYDMNVLSGKEKDTTPAPTITENSTAKYKKQKESSKGQLFQAKNVKNDYLDLRVPVWITDLQFVDDEANQLAIGTHYHQIRVYDIKTARRPVLDVEVGNKPIKRISVGINDDQILYADTTNDLGAIDLKSGKTMAQYKGLTGAATAFCTATDNENNSKIVVSVSLDRFLRIHETTSIHRKLLNKAYLKQRLTAVLVDEDHYVEEPAKKDADEEDDALWNTLTVTSSKRKNRSS
ncbi:WD40-repeat-containing domain protein [Umbelopsis sp. AD052]|nr:WD40-repeat-containing domain protein [Umbelopsis sp. AD052]